MENAVSVGSENIENGFQSLSPKEKTSVISHGVAVLFSNLNNRLFLASSKIHFFENKYRMTLSELDQKGLPESGDVDAHEDYIMWHHWSGVAEDVSKQIASLRPIAGFGVYR